MTDRPTLEQLLDAVRLHLETLVIPAVKAEPKLYFQTLVAANVLKIAQREVAHGDSLTRAEWVSLNALTGESQPIPPTTEDRHTALTARNQQLAHDIRAGIYDEPDMIIRLAEHLEKVVSAQLMLNAPALAARFKAEDQSGGHPE